MCKQNIRISLLWTSSVNMLHFSACYNFQINFTDSYLRLIPAQPGRWWNQNFMEEEIEAQMFNRLRWHHRACLCGYKPVFLCFIIYTFPLYHGLVLFYFKVIWGEGLDWNTFCIAEIHEFVLPFFPKIRNTGKSFVWKISQCKSATLNYVQHVYRFQRYRLTILFKGYPNKM